jgi:hypothetical protein
MNPAEHVLYNCLPYKLYQDEQQFCCHWLNMGELKFSEPFFEHTLSRIKILPENLKKYKQTGSLSLLPEWSQGLVSVKPAAFIFHVSRCGSTLVSQSLSLDPRNIVLSEVPFLDELLRLQVQHADISSADVEEWLNATLRFYAQQRTGAEENLFIKTDCWHIFFYEQLRKLYPEVPFILLYRTPDEVLHSQQKRRGMQAVPGMIEPELMGIGKHEIDYTDFDGYFSMVLEKILAAFCKVLDKDPLTVAVNYNEGITTILQKIAAVSGYTITPDLLENINERSRYHAKYPESVFAGDEKPSAVHPALHRAMHWYRQLEEKRLLRVSTAE